MWRRLHALTAAVSAASLLAFASRAGWPLELFCHFRLQYAVALAVPLIAYLIGKRVVASTIPATFLVLQIASIAPLWTGAPAPVAPSSTTVRGVVANLLAANDDAARFLAWVREVDPDFILALEVDTHWSAALAALEGDWRYHLTVAREDNFGIAFYSKVPATSLETRRIGANHPTVVAELDVGDDGLCVYGVHTLPPTSRSAVASQRAQLRALAEEARRRGEDGAAIIAGDLNTTSWAPVFRELLEESGMRDSRVGFGVQGTWPALPAPFRIAIDHVLVSEGVGVVERRVGPSVGSDHRPVYIELAVP